MFRVWRDCRFISGGCLKRCGNLRMVSEIGSDSAVSDDRRVYRKSIIFVRGQKI